VENMFAPEVFSSFASSFAIASGAVTIKLVSARWDNSVEPAVQRAVVVGRITMPLQGAQTLAAGLTSFLGKLGLEIGQADIPRKRASDAVASSPILRSQSLGACGVNAVQEDCGSVILSRLRCYEFLARQPIDHRGHEQHESG